MTIKDLSSTADVSAARESLNADFQSLMSHAEDLLNATTSLSGESVDLARKKLGETVAALKAQIGPARDAAMAHTKAAADAAVTFAKEKPWQTAAIVVLAALTLGFLTSLSRDK